MQFSVIRRNGRPSKMYAIATPRTTYILKSANLFRTRIRFSHAASFLYQYAHSTNARQLFYNKSNNLVIRGSLIYYIIRK